MTTPKTPHVHTANERAGIYEACVCGAIRRRDSLTLPPDTWHVCALCVAPEFRWFVQATQDPPHPNPMVPQTCKGGYP